MRRFRRLLLALAIIGTLAGGAPAPVEAAVPVKIEARCYFMRGLLGGALGYSYGMDVLAAKVAGVGCKGYVKPHWRWREFVATAAANYRRDGLPVFIGGHSVGADAVTSAAEALRRLGVPVTVAFYYDPTSLVEPVPTNVGRAIEFRNVALFQLGQGVVTLSPGYSGTSQIYSKAIAHVALDDDPTVHATTLCEIRDKIAKALINICPVVGWLATVPFVSGIPSIIPTTRAGAPRVPVVQQYRMGPEPGG